VETTRRRTAGIHGTHIRVIATYICNDTRAQIARVCGTQVIIITYDGDILTQSCGFITGIIGTRIIIITHYFIENTKPIGTIIVGAQIIVVADDGLGDAGTRSSIAEVSSTVIIIVAHDRSILATLHLIAC
jgi:hypothetical protein